MENSSRRKPHRTLARRLDAFLTEVANTDSLVRLARYDDLLPPHLDSRHSVEHFPSVEPDKWREDALAEYQHLIRGVWSSPNNETRRFFSFHLRRKLYEVLEAMARESIPKTIERTGRAGEGVFRRVAEWKTEYSDMMRRLPSVAFETAIDRLDDLRDRAKVCANPDCDAKFFIAERRTQRYCAEKCAGHFQRQWKRNWWHKDGKDWRENRKEQAKGKKLDGKKTR